MKSVILRKRQTSKQNWLIINMSYVTMEFDYNKINLTIGHSNT